ncbi:MAG: DUF433 domain-containing protein [Chromatiales bacterium]|nr:DUF433 domain-containing protein [Chromatiales bacterium]
MQLSFIGTCHPLPVRRRRTCLGTDPLRLDALLQCRRHWWAPLHGSAKGCRLARGFPTRLPPTVAARSAPLVRLQRGVSCVRDLRIPVATVVGLVAQGMTEDRIVAEYPDLEVEDIRQALAFAAAAVDQRQGT